ncbi:MAG: hypothetical protein SOR11_00585 [Fusobacterium sp.]|uniref:hypothetical protein n=1 Tax=Fusobacterium sp. TaxID=68766 RepID=UPI002A74A35A|nr:hypothetical protein [Fusobacterium sp.]MDY3058486.1 hypothetical protein [Fusobacterium sp.]
MTHIYDNNLKFLLTLNYNYEDFIKEPAKYYPEWQTSYYATQEKYEHPIFDSESSTIREMNKYEKFKAGLYELAYNEVEHKGDILTLETGQYVNEAGELITIPKLEGTRVEWNWETHTWEEKATMLEIIQAQYAEYDGMDTYSTVEEMKRINPAMAEEFVNMLIELRQMAYSLEGTVETQAVGYTTLPIPKPSKSLEKYLEMRKIVKLGKNN